MLKWKRYSLLFTVILMLRSLSEIQSLDQEAIDAQIKDAQDQVDQILKNHNTSIDQILKNQNTSIDQILKGRNDSIDQFLKDRNKTIDEIKDKNGLEEIFGIKTDKENSDTDHDFGMQLLAAMQEFPPRPHPGLCTLDQFVHHAVQGVKAIIPKLWAFAAKQFNSGCFRAYSSTPSSDVLALNLSWVPKESRGTTNIMFSTKATDSIFQTLGRQKRDDNSQIDDSQVKLEQLLLGLREGLKARYSSWQSMMNRYSRQKRANVKRQAQPNWDYNDYYHDQPPSEESVDVMALINMFMDLSKCSPRGDLKGLLTAAITPDTLDALLVSEPTLWYMKNSFIRKWLVKGKPLYSLLFPFIDMVSAAFYEGLELQIDLVKVFLDDPTKYTFDKYDEITGEACLLYHAMFTGFRDSMNKLGGGCKAEEEKIDRIWKSMFAGMCDVSSSAKWTINDDTKNALKSNFGYLFNFGQCVMTKDNTVINFEDARDTDVQEFMKTARNAIVRCPLESTLDQLALNFEEFFLHRYKPTRHSVIMAYKHILTTGGRITPMMRCMAKTFHPYCAKKKVDLSIATQQLMPMMTLGSYGMLLFDKTKMDYTAPQKLGINRKTVMIVGDPHIRTFKDNDKYQTCNELSTFDSSSSSTEKEKTTSHRKITLLTNEFFHLEADFGRWSSDLNGTFVKNVSLSILSKLDTTADGEPESIYLTYDFNKDALKESEPRFNSDKYVEAKDPEDSEGKRTYKKMTRTPLGGKVQTEELDVMMEYKMVRGEKSLVIKERKSGTMVAFSNPSGDMVNVYVRGGEQLFDISEGLLISGCPDSNRTELLEEAKASANATRRKRATSCDGTCSSIERTFAELCSYDCVQGAVAGVTTVTNAYTDAQATVTEVVENAANDKELEGSSAREESAASVDATTASSEDKEASGGSQGGVDLYDTIVSSVLKEVPGDVGSILLETYSGEGGSSPVRPQAMLFLFTLALITRLISSIFCT